MPRRIMHSLEVTVGATTAAFAVWWFLMPNVEQSRSEVLLDKAYREVHTIRDTVPRVDGRRTVELRQRDPWGQPYRLVSRDGKDVRVVSSGPNRTSTSDGRDGDDIDSEMSSSPAEAIRMRKERQSLMAITAALAASILVAVTQTCRRRATW